MPLAAWAIAKLLRMPPDLTAGMVLIGSVASGTASNVMIYLARGDVALSVTISALSTLVGVFATPLLTRLYVDASIAVDVHGMLMSILQIVALPIVAGLIIISAFGATQNNLLTNARIVFAMGEGRDFYSWTGRVHPRWGTPGNSVIVIGVWSMLFVLSGSFDIKSFLDGYYDDNAYFNNPTDYLVNSGDEWFLSRYRQMKIVLGTSDWDMCLDANVKMAGILQGKGIPHWLDIYGDNSKHDWPLWQRMAGKYF